MSQSRMPQADLESNTKPEQKSSMEAYGEAIREAEAESAKVREQRPLIHQSIFKKNDKVRKGVPLEAVIYHSMH